MPAMYLRSGSGWSLTSSSLGAFFFTATATTVIYTLSLHDALPIYVRRHSHRADQRGHAGAGHGDRQRAEGHQSRSEEHTSELQSRQYLVCRLLLEKKKHHETVSS